MSFFFLFFSDSERILRKKLYSRNPNYISQYNSFDCVSMHVILITEYYYSLAACMYICTLVSLTLNTYTYTVMYITFDTNL